MKSIVIIPVLFILLLFSCARKEQVIGKNEFTAEDLWGNSIPLSEIIAGDKPTVIVPFSTSVCGFCLIDGFYGEQNYLVNNSRTGGHSFHMCLFNPQPDIYTFQKHFKWEFPILTYPPTLFKFQMSGYPIVLSFKKGRQVTREFRSYDRVDSLGALLGDSTWQRIPTGDVFMGTRLIFGNNRMAAVRVYPNGVEIPARIIEQQKRYKSYLPKHTNQLTEEDLNKHLFFSGDFPFAEIAAVLGNRDIPVRFTDGTVSIGPYRFNYDSTEILFACPNPFNRTRYLVVRIRHSDAPNSPPHYPDYTHYLDYIFHRKHRDTTTRLLYGHFDHSDPYHWKFSEELAFSQVNRQQFCQGKCDLPKIALPAERDTGPIRYSSVTGAYGQLYSFGTSNCRFPDLMVDPSDNIWISWEEDGDIHLAEIAQNGTIVTRKIENNVADSYLPKLAYSDNEVWVFYLNNQDRYYRLYVKQFDGIRLSDELLISPREPFDVVTPAVAYRPEENEITVAWSAWLANLRVPFYRKIASQVLSDIQEIRICDPIYSKDYINAWCFSLCYDNGGKVWGAWNQHYPATLGVCGGILGEQARSITRTAKRMDDWEIGGYPCMFTDGKTRYIVWEGYGRPTFRGKSQSIKFAVYNEEKQQWQVGEKISLDDQTLLNHTPVGAADDDGRLWVAYSGRPKGEKSVWGIYLTFRKDNRWSRPVRISQQGESARFPRIVADRSGNLWISWHQGTGEGMQVRVLRLDKNRFLAE